MKSVPKAAFLGNPKLYAECFLRNRPAMSIDGRFPEGCVETAAKALASVKPELADFKFDAAAAYTNRFEGLISNPLSTLSTLRPGE